MEALARQILNFKKVYVLGTSTDIGKTYVGTRLLDSLLGLNKSYRPLKPVETGLEGRLVGSDTAAYLDILERHGITASAAEVNPFHLDLPCSPHLSQELEEKQFTADAICEKIDSVDFGLIEFAGGLLVPINERETQLDVLRKRPFPSILVADAGLGTINHSLLTIQVLKQWSLPLLAVVLNRYEKDNFIHQKNVEYLAGKVPVYTLGIAG